MKKGKRQWLAWMMAVILLVTLLPASVFASEELFQDGTVTEQEPVTEIVPAPEENPALEENSTSEENPALEENSTPEENPVLEENPTSDEESVPQDEPALEENPGEEDSREQLFGDGTGDMTESAAVDLAGAVGFSAEEVPLFSAGETAGEVPSGGEGITDADYTLYYNHTDGKLHKNSIGGDVVETEEGFSYSGSGSTLTLSGFRFTTSAATGVVLPDGTTMEVTGDNSITVLDNSSDGIHGIMVENQFLSGDCILKGAGGLTITTGGTVYSSYGIKAKFLTIQGGEYQFFHTTDAEQAYGVYCDNLIMEGGQLFVRKGQEKSAKFSHGVACGENLKIKGASVLSVEREAARYGLVVAGNSPADFSGLTTGTITLAGTEVTQMCPGGINLPVPAEVKEGPDYIQDADLNTTKDVRITKGAAKPEITGQPAGAVYPWGSVAVQPLEVKAQTSDTGELTYQWFSNTENSTTGGSAITGADAGTSSYRPDLTAVGTLYYYCVVTNTWNGKTAATSSNVAAITVTEPTLYYNSADGKLYKSGHYTPGTEYTGQPGKWSGDGATLTLNGFDFTTAAPIGLVMPDEENTIHLVEGTTNRITSVFEGEDKTMGIYGSSKLSITGKGELAVRGGTDTGGDNDRETGSFGIGEVNILSIIDATVRCYGGDVGNATLSRVYSSGIIISSGTLNIRNAVVEAEGGNAAEGYNTGIIFNGPMGGIVIYSGSLITSGDARGIVQTHGEEAYNISAATILADTNRAGTSKQKLDSISNTPGAANYIGNYKWMKFISATAEVNDVEVDGRTNTAITSRNLVINTRFDSFRGIPEGADVSSWFTNMPPGLQAKVSAPVERQAFSIGITISGTPGAALSAPMEITIPAAQLTNQTAIRVAENAAATWNIRSPYVPSIYKVRQITVTAVGDLLEAPVQTLVEGGSLELQAVVKPDYATNKAVTWSVENGTGEAAIAEVETTVTGIPAAVLTAVKPGTVTVKATAKDGSGVVGSREFTITAKEVPVTKLQLNKNSTTLFLGRNETLQAVVFPENAANKSLKWKSSRPGAVTVTSTGKIKAVGPGSATITCMAQDGSGAKATCKVTVKRTNTRVATLKGKPSDNIIKLTWTKVHNAKGYEIYGAKCGEEDRLLATVKGGTVTKWTAKNLNTKINYKFCVRAFRDVNGTRYYLKTTNKIHVAASAATHTNARAVQVDFAQAQLKTGGTAQIHGRLTKEMDKKKLLQHLPELSYVTSDKKVAVVSEDGLITAVGEGTCYVYVYANNGVNKKISVKVD